MGNSTTSETTTRTMGTTLTTEQHNNVINGTAVLLDRYHSYPAGVAAKSFYGSLNTKTKGSTLVLRKQIGKVDIDQPAVTEMMARLGATDLYEEFMDAVFAVTGMWWRRQLLELRASYAPRFFAFGIDVWVCKKHVGGKHGWSEYWMLFVDRSVAPCNFKQSINWNHLLWGMGTGLQQQDMSPIIQSYLQQLKSDESAIVADDLTKKSDLGTVAPTLISPHFHTAPPPYTAELQV